MSNTPHPSSQRDKHLDRACTDVHWAFFPEGLGFFLSMFFLLSIHSKNCQAGRSETWLPVTKCDLCGTAGSSRSEVLPSMPAAALAPGCVNRGLGGTGEGAVLGTTERLLQRKSGIPRRQGSKSKQN